MTRRWVILVSLLVLVSGLLLHLSIDSGASVVPALAQAEPTSTRPPVPPLATATPEPAATSEPPPSQTNKESTTEPPTTTPTVIPIMPEAGGKTSLLSISLLSLTLLIAGAVTMIGCAHKAE
jgi:hypothetical protein